LIVADASALVELLFQRSVAESLRARLSGDVVHAPYVIEIETLHALRRASLTGAISDDRASLARDELASIPLRLYPHRPLMRRIWELRHTHSAYDASYVALAELLPAPLVTCDARLARLTGHRANIELFAPA
jgi:predicted nucleic acid-binding protein